jgi:hypothetical protein
MGAWQAPWFTRAHVFHVLPPCACARVLSSMSGFGAGVLSFLRGCATSPPVCALTSWPRPLHAPSLCARCLAVHVCNAPVCKPDGTQVSMEGVQEAQDGPLAYKKWLAAVAC